MPKKPKETLVFQDIAAANLGFELAQVAIDVLIKHNLMTSAEVKELFEAMAARYEAPGNPDRFESRKAAAQVLRKTVALKYNIPPKHKQN